MKVCILSAVNIKHMSMVSIYTKWMRENNVEFDIIYMDKYDEAEESLGASSVYRFINIIENRQFILLKFFKYMKFRPYAKELLIKNKYDFIIVWNDLAIYLLGDILGGIYKNKYCLNIRDTNGKILLYPKKWFEKCFKNAVFCTVSSDEYIPLLPKREYIHLHSFNESILREVTPNRPNKNENQPIVIGFIGYIRFMKINRRLLDVFANDRRFILGYFGTRANVLKKYAEDKKIKNTVFHDSFPISRTREFIENIDIMNNIYGNRSKNLRTALSIRLYYSLWSRIPILVSPNTYMERITKLLSIGFVVNKIEPQIKDLIYDWYRSIDHEIIDYKASKYIDEINEQNRILIAHLDELLLD